MSSQNSSASQPGGFSGFQFHGSWVDELSTGQTSLYSYLSADSLVAATRYAEEFNSTKELRAPRNAVRNLLSKLAYEVQDLVYGATPSDDPLEQAVLRIERGDEVAEALAQLLEEALAEKMGRDWAMRTKLKPVRVSWLDEGGFFRITLNILRRQKVGTQGSWMVAQSPQDCIELSMLPVVHLARCLNGQVHPQDALLELLNAMMDVLVSGEYRQPLVQDFQLRR